MSEKDQRILGAEFQGSEAKYSTESVAVLHLVYSTVQAGQAGKGNILQAAMHMYGTTNAQIRIKKP